MSNAIDPIKDFDKWIENLKEIWWDEVGDELSSEYGETIDSFEPPSEGAIRIVRLLLPIIGNAPDLSLIYTVDCRFCFIARVSNNTDGKYLTILRSSVNFLLLADNHEDCRNLFARVPDNNIESNTKLQEIITLFLS